MQERLTWACCVALSISTYIYTRLYEHTYTHACMPTDRQTASQPARQPPGRQAGRIPGLGIQAGSAKGGWDHHHDEQRPIIAGIRITPFGVTFPLTLASFRQAGQLQILEQAGLLAAQQPLQHAQHTTSHRHHATVGAKGGYRGAGVGSGAASYIRTWIHRYIHTYLYICLATCAYRCRGREMNRWKAKIDTERWTTTVRSGENCASKNRLQQLLHTCFEDRNALQ